MQVMSNGRVKRSEAEWKGIIARWQKSGLKPRGFCRREQIQFSSFLRWQRRLGGPESTTSASQFVEVTRPFSSSERSWVVEITLPNGCAVRFQG